MRFLRLLATISLVAAGAAGCSLSGRPEPSPLAVRPVSGPLAIRVVYPDTSAVVAARDSTFLYGSVGSGDATLSVNGRGIPVWPNGSWLAWVPIPHDTVAIFRLEARLAEAVDTMTFVLRLRAPPPECGQCLWLDAGSLAPRGRVVLPEGEPMFASLRATSGAEVRLLLPWGDTVRFAEDPLPAEPAWGVRAFAVDSTAGILPAEPGRYVGGVTAPPSATIMMRGEGSEPPPEITGIPFTDGDRFENVATVGDLLDPSTAGELWPDPLLEVIRAPDTLLVVWPLRLEPAPTAPVLVTLDDDTAGRGITDGVVNGRARPGGTYHWFFPTGTVAAVEARRNDLVRLDLSERADAWVSANEIRPLGREAPMQIAIVGSIRVEPSDDRLTIRIPISTRAPFRIDETDRSLVVRIYRAKGDPDWIQYGPLDPLLELIEWDQPVRDEVVLRFDLSRRVWGYRTRWRGRELVLEVHRPPEPDARRPLTGRSIALDAGHPPAGSTGPSGQREPEVTLAVARLARDMLEARGARVIMTRDTDTAVALDARTLLAERAGAEVLVSIHTNGLPDGVNPFANSGSSAYYFHRRSAPLARAINRRVVEAFRSRDLGIGRGDLRLVRPSWFPAVLVEGLFQMLPEHDGWLATEEGRRRYASAVVLGLEDFFREVALHP